MPKFSLQVTPAVKKGKDWEVTALATVLYGNRAPDPPEEVVFDVNGEEFQRVETSPESGTASSVMLLQSGGYIVTAYRSQARGEARTSRFAIREEKKLTKDEKRANALETKVKLIEAEKKFKNASRELKELKEIEGELEPPEIRRRRTVKPNAVTEGRSSETVQPDPLSSFRRGQEAARRLFGQRTVH